MLPQDSPSAISKAALSGKDEKASEAVDIFLSIIGAEAGHMGLRLLAKGGVYICGGITPKVPVSIFASVCPERGVLALRSKFTCEQMLARSMDDGRRGPDLPS